MSKKWTEGDTAELERWYIRAKNRRNAHEVSFGFFNFWNKVLTFPSVLLSSILSTTTLNQTTDDPVIANMNAAIAIILTFMTSTNTFFCPAKKATGHRTMSRNMGKLMADIELELRRSKTDQCVDFLPFIEKISERFGLAKDEAPPLTKAGRAILNEGRKELESPFDLDKPHPTACVELGGPEVAQT